MQERIRDWCRYAGDAFDDHAFRRTVACDDEGRFAIRGLWPGEYVARCGRRVARAAAGRKGLTLD